MLRPVRLIMMVLLAMFIVAVPTAVAQDPTTDQYSAPVEDDTGAAPAEDEGFAPEDDEGGAAPAEDEGAAPVQVRRATVAQTDSLPFTGGQISLIALIGLALLAIGAVGIASSRRRSSANTS